MRRGSRPKGGAKKAQGMPSRPPPEGAAARRIPPGAPAARPASEARLADALAQQAATSELLRVISSSRADLQPVFDAIVKNAERLCDSELSAVARIADGQLHLVAVSNVSPEEAAVYRRLFPRPPERGFAMGRAVVDGATVHIADVLADPDYDRRTQRALLRTAGYRTFLAVPIMRAGVPIGVIGCARRVVKPFAASQIDLVKTFADQAVIAIENAQLLGEVQERNRDLTETLAQQTATGDILRVISSSPTDVQPVFEIVAERAARLCEATRTWIFRVDGERPAAGRDHGRDPGGHRDRAPGVPDAARLRGRRRARCRERRRRPRPGRDGRSDGRDEVGGGCGRLDAAASGPRCCATGSRSASSSFGRSRSGPFSEQRLELLKTFADQAVIAIENVRLFTEVQARNRDLTESLEQQTATAEILRAISSSPTDIRPVLETVVQARGALLRGAGRGDPAARRRRAPRGGRGRAVRARAGLPVGGHRGARAPGEHGLGERPGGPGAAHRPRPRSRRRAARTSSRWDATCSAASATTPSLATPLLREGTPLGAIVLFRTEVAALLRPPARARQDLRRPGGHRDRERPALPGAGGPQPRPHRDPGAADRDRRDPARHQQLADRRPAGVRDHRQERRGLCAGRDSAGVFMYDGEMVRLEALRQREPGPGQRPAGRLPEPGHRGHRDRPCAPERPPRPHPGRARGCRLRARRACGTPSGSAPCSRSR